MTPLPFFQSHCSCDTDYEIFLVMSVSLLRVPLSLFAQPLNHGIQSHLQDHAFQPTSPVGTNARCQKCKPPFCMCSTSPPTAPPFGGSPKPFAPSPARNSRPSKLLSTMACTRKAAVGSLSLLVASAVLIVFLTTQPDVRTLPDAQKPSDGAPEDQTLPGTTWSGLLTHRDAEHLPGKGGESPFFKRHGLGALQGQRAYWERLVGQAVGGNERRSLLGGAVQNVPINGTLETGNYFVTMQLGTPPQNVTLLLDTGSSLFWVECNQCADCTGLTDETAFQPQLSSSIVTPGCGNCPDYEYGLCASAPDVSSPSELDACFSLCAANKKQCYYGYSYGDGSQTGGYIQKDILTVPSSNSSAIFSNVTFGCNYLAADPNNPATTQLIVGPSISGLVGLGKSNYSVQNQLASAGVIQPAFSVCLAGVEGGGVFTLGNSSRVIPGMQYIPMGTHPEYYNVTLAGIFVGNAQLPISPSVFFLQPPISRFRRANPFFLPDAIFDTGTSFTILPNAAYGALTQGFLNNAPLGNAPVYIDQYGYIVSISGGPASTGAPAPTAVISEPGVPRTGNNSSPNQLCFNIPARQIGPRGQIDVSAFPNVTFSFVNSPVLLTVNPNDYMFIFETTDLSGFTQALLACPTFVSDGGVGTTILGEYTMRNHFMVFDTAARRIGVVPVNCSKYT